MKKWRWLIVLAALAIAGGAYWVTRPKVYPGLVVASGRIEGRITTISPKTAAWVKTLYVNEGEKVEKGKPIVVLHDTEQEKLLLALQENLKSLQEQLRAQNIDVEVSERQARTRIASAQAAIVSAQATIARDEANALQAARDARRWTDLERANFASPTQAEAERLKEEVSRRVLTDSRARGDQARHDLELARLELERVQVLKAQRDATLKQIDEAKAQVERQKSILDDFTIPSPLDGAVLTRPAEVGERLNPNSTIFTLVDMNKLYLKVYIPEPLIGKVALGQEAQVWVDAYPDKPFAAKVSRIYQQAEFTPKNVETREERVKLVFAAELAFDENPAWLLKPGMPGDGVIRVEPQAPWLRPW